MPGLYSVHAQFCMRKHAILSSLQKKKITRALLEFHYNLTPWISNYREHTVLVLSTFYFKSGDWGISCMALDLHLATASTQCNIHVQSVDDQGQAFYSQRSVAGIFWTHHDIHIFCV